jgi:hypothetical protein
MDLYRMWTRIIISILISILLIACHNRSIHHPPAVIEEEIVDPIYNITSDKENYITGDVVAINISQEGPVFIRSKLIIENGPQVYNKVLPKIQDYFLVLPETFTRHAGNYKMGIFHNDKVMFLDSFNIVPQTSQDLYILTGPRSIYADGRDASMIVTIPEDKYGNVVQEGTPIYYESLSKSNKENMSIVPIMDQVSYDIILSDTKASTHYVGVTDLKNSSLEQRIDFVPLWPAAITISNDDYYPYANNKNFVDIKTNELFDSHQNQISEGTYIRYVLTDNYGKKSIYNSLVIDGVARVSIKNPNYPKTLSVYAESSNGIRSNKITLRFKPDITSIPYAKTDTTIVAGPLVSQLGQLISEGTEVILSVGNNVYKEESYKGFAKFQLKLIEYNEGDNFIIKTSGIEQKGQF